MTPARRTRPRDAAPLSPGPRIGLALGGGGARGLAHIAVLEAFDEAGVAPALIVGASMGAIVGAAYAAGIPGKRLRTHVLGQFRRRSDVLVKLLEARVGRLGDLLSRFGNPALVDGERLLDLFWPSDVPDRFEDLTIPFEAVATDYFGRRAHVFESGALVTAVAASMAVPGLVKVVETQGMSLIDGGAVDPLPYARLFGRVDYVVAVDVTGGPAEDGAKSPEPFAAMLGASQIMQNAIVAGKLKARPPDLLIRPAVDSFRALDFFRAADILAASAKAKAQTRDALEALKTRG